MFSKSHQIKLHISLKLVLAVFCFFQIKTTAQVDTTINLTFDFNEHQIKEKDDKIIPRELGVTLMKDRFGNEKSAAFLRGDVGSYLNLGTTKLLKSPNMTISFWVNLIRRNYAGRGNDWNPFIQLNNGPGSDFIMQFQ